MSIGRIVTTHPLTRFAELAHHCGRQLRRIYVVSPWIISARNEDFIPLVQILQAVRESGARLSVLTRSPEGANHERAIRLCDEVPQSETLYLDSLHAKLYLLEANGLRAAMIGSPNFTPHGDSVHRELAVEIRSIKDADPGSMLIDDLFAFAREVMSERAAKVHKRLAVPTR
jgi:phosphatidylserine/phosphatidylglycerophosphate/cardiolipin synthase-like enzyme